MQENIKNTTLSKLFMEMGNRSATGILTVVNGRKKASIHFYNGDITSAMETNAELEYRLGNSMVSLGLVTEGDISFAVSMQKATKKKLGQLLVDRKLITTQELRDALKYQSLQLIYRLFKMENASYSFAPDFGHTKEKYCFDPVSVKTVLEDGKKMVEQWQEVVPS